MRERENYRREIKRDSHTDIQADREKEIKEIDM